MELQRARVWHAIPQRPRRAGGRALRRLRAQLTDHRPVVSVVLPIADIGEAPLRDTLTSLSDQTHPRLQVLLAPYSPNPGVERVVTEFVDRDYRFERVREPGATLGTARNAALKKVRGEYVAFARGGDTLPRTAIERLVATLSESGSDFAFGAIAVAPGVPGRRVAPLQKVHRRGARLADVPNAMTDARPEGKLFRTSFWTGHRLAFETEPGPDQTGAVTRAFLLAERFDQLPLGTYRVTGRAGGLAVGAAANAFVHFEQWQRIQNDLLPLAQQVSPEARRAWVIGLLDGEIAPFLDDAERASEDEWRRLVELATRLLEEGGDEVLPHLRSETRVKVWLASRGLREELEELVAARWHEYGNVRTRVEHSDGGGGSRRHVYAELPFFRDERLQPPDALFELHEVETPLVAKLAGRRWVDAHTIELDLHAYVSLVSLDEAPRTTVTVVREDGSGERLELPVRAEPSPEVDRVARHRNQTYAHGRVLATLDTRRLATGSSRPGDSTAYRVEVTVETQGIRRDGHAVGRIGEGSAGVIDPRGTGGAVVGVRDQVGAVQVVAEVPQAWAADLALDGRTLTGRIVPPGGAAGSPAGRLGEVQLRHGEQRVRTAVATDGRFTITAPSGVTETLGEWSLETVVGGREVAVAWPDLEPSARLAPADPEGAELQAFRTQDGTVTLREGRGLAAVRSVDVEGDTLLVRLVWLGPRLDAWQVTLRGNGLRVPGEVVEETLDGCLVRFPLLTDPWGFGATLVPEGVYRLTIDKPGVVPGGRERADYPVLLDEELLDRLPIETVAGRLRYRLTRWGLPHEFRITLKAPIPMDVYPPFHQTRLQQRFLTSAEPLDPSLVYFQAYAGGHATDSQVAIHQELRRTRPDLKLHWGVLSHSSWLPEGAIPLLRTSEEWYDVVARTPHLVMNVDLERWMTLRPGQRLLQTFHGYPAKTMGIALWRSKQFTPKRIAQELARTSGDWSLALTPAPEMDVHYRVQYAYDGPIHSHGYPRDDVLVSPGADALRADIRARLGIREDQTVVLYAPTWRDDQAESYSSAAMVSYLDVEKASEALGDDYVLLLRGHRFMSGRDSRADARIIDVTTYPEINHLILAADVAVLDYSSLRFDFALTGRPMIFLVPDLDRYAGTSRGFLFPYVDTAPGPLLATTEQVIAALRDLEGVRTQHQAAYDTFNKTYNYLMDGTSTRRVIEAFFGEGFLRG